MMCTPLTLSTATIDKHGKVQLFVNNDKLTKELRDYLGENVTFFDESSIENKLNLLSGYRVLVDPSSASSWFFDTLKDSQAVILKAQDPIALPRACKNVTEIKSTIKRS